MNGLLSLVWALVLSNERSFHHERHPYQPDEDREARGTALHGAISRASASRFTSAFMGASSTSTERSMAGTFTGPEYPATLDHIIAGVAG